MPTITIRKGREKPISQQHPWVFSGSIQSAEDAQPGDIVTLVSHRGEFLAQGYWNPKSQIQVRLLSWRKEPIDADWWRNKLERAVQARANYSSDDPTGYRLINAENDFLPGLVVDRYGDWLVLQALTLGIDRRKQILTEILAEMLQPKGIYERSDVDARGRESLEPEIGLLWGEEPPEHIVINEMGLNTEVDVRKGHKTGFYLDQAPNRHLLNTLITANFGNDTIKLLNLFSYTGGFSLHALAASDDVYIVNVDSSQEALKIGARNLRLNDFSPDQVDFIQADVFEYLREAVARRDQHDIIVLDPPKFAHNKQQVEKAARGYKNTNLNAFKLVKPGGYLLTFSCSGAISADLFQKIVFGALADSGRQAQIVQHLGPGDDHPVALTFPEGGYLKGLLLRVY